MRNIYIVNATHVVVSDANPQGVYSVISGYPKTFDSRNYNHDLEKTLRVAKAEYLSRVSALLAADNRAMWTVTLTRDDGRQIMRESYGAFPDEPQTEPEPVVKPEEPVEPENPEEPTAE